MMLGGQKAWDRHAAILRARLAHIQVHVNPDWLYALCTSCGWSYEPTDMQIPAFRYTVATHECSHQEENSPVAAADDGLVLF